MLKQRIHQLLNAEIPDITIPKQWNIVERMMLVGYNLMYSALLFLSYPSSFLGFGLGEDFQPTFILSLFETLKQEHTSLFYGSLALITFHYLFRIQIMIRGQLHYKTNDPRLPTKTLLLFSMANSLNVFFVMTTGLLAGLVLWALGGDFATGLHWLNNAFWYTVELANRVPTIVELPYLVAFIFVFLFHGLLHYWVHRICHMNRFLWLALHRFHHMPETLTNASTTVVVTSVPFFALMLIPKVFLYAATSKLFYAEPLFMEMFFSSLILWLPDPYAHQTALYKEAVKSRFIRWFSFFATAQGVYHYLHHTNDPKIMSTNKTNLINIGGGLFHIWDIVFKTYHPLTDPEKETPSVGLWEKPQLHHNPIRLLFSGLYQLAYEVKNNKGIKTKLLCVFGSTSYTPPITRDYHISNSTAVATGPGTDPDTDPGTATPEKMMTA